MRRRGQVTRTEGESWGSAIIDGVGAWRARLLWFRAGIRKKEIKVSHLQEA